MKNILLLFSFILIASMGYSQVKVFSNGNTKVGLTSAANVYGAPFEVRKDINGYMGEIISNLNPGSLSRAQLDILAGSTSNAFSMQMFAPANSSSLGGIVLGGWGKFQSSSAANGFIFNVSSATQSLVFMSGSLERMRVNAGGNVGIGYTSPAHKLHVNGDVVANNVSASSDKRLKKNISKLEYGLDEILRLEPVQFQYNGKGQIEDTETVQFGLIAQDVQKIFPELVNSYEMTEYSVPLIKSLDDPTFNREDYASQAEYLLIRDSHIKFALINAVKEQQDMIDDQQDQIDDLKAQVSDLVDLIRNGENTSTEHGTIGDTDTPAIFQNNPNPFDNYTNIDFVIPETAQNVKINFYNINGAVINSQIINTRGKGNLNLEASDLPSGTYSYALEIDGKVVKTLKMVVAK